MPEPSRIQTLPSLYVSDDRSYKCRLTFVRDVVALGQETNLVSPEPSAPLDTAPEDSASFDESSVAQNPSRRSNQPRRFRSLQAIHLKPLKRRSEHGVPSCDIQIRSYSVRNLEFFADFALRAAYYLGLPASGPVPLPRLIERWTVPRSNFIFKKSQENFERITMRRLIQIRDGPPQSVELWLAFLRKHQYYGIGMKANVWQFEPLGQSRIRSLLYKIDLIQM